MSSTAADSIYRPKGRQEVPLVDELQACNAHGSEECAIFLNNADPGRTRTSGEAGGARRLTGSAVVYRVMEAACRLFISTGEMELPPYA